VRLRCGRHQVRVRALPPNAVALIQSRVHGSPSPPYGASARFLRDVRGWALGFVRSTVGLLFDPRGA
jgi:hypothetical protein